MKKFVKKHLSLIVAIAIFVLVFIAFLILKSVLFPSEAKAIYGNKKGLETLPIEKVKKTKYVETGWAFSKGLRILLTSKACLF